MEAVQGFVEEYGLEGPVLMDPDGTIGGLYALRATPTTFFVNAMGVIEDIMIGFVDMEWIEDKLNAQG